MNYEMIELLTHLQEGNKGKLIIVSKYIPFSLFQQAQQETKISKANYAPALKGAINS